MKKYIISFLLFMTSLSISLAIDTTNPYHQHVDTFSTTDISNIENKIKDKIKNINDDEAIIAHHKMLIKTKKTITPNDYYYKCAERLFILYLKKEVILYKKELNSYESTLHLLKILKKNINNKGK